MRHKGVIAVGLMLVVSLASARTAGGEVPTTADLAGCNDEASAAVKAGTASPIMADHARAESARAAAMTPDSMSVTGKVIESPDPQIHGMEAEGAKHAPYQGAYRSCMRRQGF